MAGSFEENYGSEEEELPPPPAPGTKPVAAPDPKAAAKLESVAKLSYRAWLWLQHHKESEYAPLARLVLSGGPDNMWVGKSLRSAAVSFDISTMYASHRDGITAKHVHLANKAVVAYREDDATVEDLMSQREVEDKKAAEYLRELESKVLTEELAKDGLEPAVMRHTQPRVGEGGLVYIKCRHINTWGKGCTRQAVPGCVKCDIHGGLYMSPEEIKDMISRGQERIVAASQTAIDTVVDLMQNSVQDAIRLKAAEMLLDRAGYRPGMELTITEAHSESGPASSPSEIIRERLARLKPQDAEAIERTKNPEHGRQRPASEQIITPEGDEVA